MNKNAKIGVLGAGVEGLETVKYLVKHGFTDLTLFDKNADAGANLPADFFRPLAELESKPELGEPLVKKVFGENYLKEAERCEVVFRSPGIPLKNLEGLRAKGVEITSATKYFFEHCPCPVIGVTGTKGKGTTSTLIYLMLKEAGKDVYLGGNIGEPPLKFLDKLTKDSLVVLELSSFQLQDLDRSPQVAVLLGVTTDHLDYHKDMDEYWEAKASIVKNQTADDAVVLNHDYESSKYYEKFAKAKKVFVSTTVSEGDGVHLMGPMIVNCAPAKEVPAGAGSESGRAAAAQQSGGTCEMIINSSKVALIGKHNFENILPAVAVARHFGVAIPQIQKVLTTFKGLPHRLEEVANVNDVKYYDDSISTTPETSIAAVRAFTQPVILIAGGSEKGADYTDWGIALQQAQNLKCVVLCGSGPGAMADRMEKALKSAEKLLNSRGLGVGAKEGGRHYPLEVIRCETFEDAMQTARAKAAPGDVVVLSPAAASFDMFKNYKERGDRFKELAQKVG
jgi:UDP-N-acetylmuramoylalanine--D-glutamate ligase